MTVRNPLATAIALLASLALAGCNGEGAPDDLSPPHVEGEMRQAEAGLRYIEVVEGTGREARPGNEVEIHYSGWLEDGRRFDTSRDGDPITFVVGAEQAIEGVEIGVVGMREGGTRRLFIPPALGFGDEGTARIPPNASLIYDIDLRRVTEQAQ
jgi:FKBP-type peptidyl-prolyl cis-trans isomerase